MTSSTTFVIKQAPRKTANIGSTEKPPVRVQVSNLESMTVGDLKNKFLSTINKAGKDINRYRFAIETSNELVGPNEKALSTFQTIKSVSGKEITILYKDLGPQISWRIVFLVEYFFPMIAFPLLWLCVRKFPTNPLTQFLYSGTSPESTSSSVIEWQDLLAILFTGHFLKREIETLMIHRFGNDTMPLSNIFKNSGYYWMFAYWIAYITMHPLYTPPACAHARITGVGLFIISELLNLKAHIDLRNLRPAGTRIRQVPKGILFRFISCPNYLFEILSWVGFTMASQSVATATFTLVGAAQMTAWAIQKHKRYRREFDGQEGRELYPRNRKILIPFVF